MLNFNNPGPVGRYCPACRIPVFDGMGRAEVITPTTTPLSEAKYAVVHVTCGTRLRPITHEDTAYDHSI